MGRLCYISRNYCYPKSAGGKARLDYETVLKKLGAHNLGLKESFYKNEVATFFLNFIGIVTFIFRLRKGDTLVLQYPIKKYFTFICRFARLRGAKVITFIHDLGSFRRKKITERQEIKKLSHSDCIIAANSQMREWLKEKGCTKPIAEMGIHDYITECTPLQHREQEEPVIIYAGVVAERKTSFLKELCDSHPDYNLCIYGDNKGLLKEFDGKKIHINGFIESDEFIKNISGDFALVWDGDSLDQCDGNFGSYLQYNSPHKVSFYIAAGLPIIIWDKAALAKEVCNEDIGITVTSLKEIPARLRQLSKERREKMRKNVLRMREEIVAGHHFMKALRKSISQLGSSINILA